MATPTTSGGYSSVPLSPYVNLNSLLSTVRWADATISYSFPAAGSAWSMDGTIGYGPTNGSGEPWNPSVAYLNASEKLRFKDALQKWSDVANINFVEVSDNQFTVGDIRIAYSYALDLQDSAAYAYLPYGEPTSGDIWINVKDNAFRSTYANGSDAYHTLIHEVGHAIGLKHPFSASPANGVTIAPQLDTLVLTAMSYAGEPGRDSTLLSFFPTTPMLYDIEAIQYMYGANRNHRAGDTNYRYDDSTPYMETIWDGGGVNTIAYAGSIPSLINLNEGSGSSIGKAVYTTDLRGNLVNYVENVWIAFDTKMKGASAGSGGDYLIGNNLGNTLIGGSGHDGIFGGTGNDIIKPEGGNDKATGGAGDDLFLGLLGKDAIYGGPGYNVLQLDGMRTEQLHVSTLRPNSFFVRDDAGNMAIVRDVAILKTANATIDQSKSGITGNVNPGLTEIYVAAFRRAPETSGYNYWAQETASKGLVAVADTIFSLDIVKNVYPANFTPNEFVTTIYKNVFDKAPDAEGMNYWTQQLAAKSRGQVVIDMTNAALAVADGVDGKDFFQNRVDWAQYAVGYQSKHKTEISVTHLTELTAGITSDPLTVLTLIGKADIGIAV